MNKIEELKTTLQHLCDISAEDATIPAEILSKVLAVCSENKVLRSKVVELNNFSETLISHLETASRESERIKLLEAQATELNGKISTLDSNAKQKDIVINDLQKQLSDKETQINSLTSSLSAKDTEIVHLNSNCNDLEEIRKAYDSMNISPYYEKLSNNMKSSLSNIFSNPAPQALLSSGIQENNIKIIYGILEDSVKENGDKDNDYDALYQIVNILFRLYNIGRKNPYIIIDPTVDTQYNDNEHRIYGNQFSGVVTKTLLFGYKTSKEVIKKAFIEVK